MKKTIPQIQHSRLLALYHKLSARLNKRLANGSFQHLSARAQRILLAKIEKLKRKLFQLGKAVAFSGAMSAAAIFINHTAGAQTPTTQGSEFQVNSYTTLEQNYSSMAMDSDGDYVITWNSNGQDGSYYAIYAQRYNATGVPQGTEFQVNNYTTSSQINSAIAMDNDGNFVITWESIGQDGDGSGIYAKRYNSTGVVQGTEFRVNSYTTSNQMHPTIAMDSDGDFVIAWSSYNQDGYFDGIFAQRYNATGTTQGAEFQVNTYTSGSQGYPDIAIDSDGDFIIAWHSLNQDYDNYGVYAQRYDAAGNPQGTEFQVHAYTTDIQYLPTVAMDSDGDFVITWSSKSQDGDDYGIYAKRFNAAGLAQGSEFLVNTYTTNQQINSSIAMNSGGDFLITWRGEGLGGDDIGIFAKRYNASGVAQGAEFMVNTYTTNTQHEPILAMDSDGDFVITWTSRNQDGDHYGIYSQRYIINRIPTDLSLSATAIDENVAANSTVGSLSTIDLNQGDTFTYTLVSGTGDTDNASFNISGSDLRITASPDFETKSSYSIRIRSTDQGGLSFEKVFTITINDISETSAVLKGANGAALQLYPNPAIDLVFANLEGNAQIRLLDLSGKVVLETTLVNQHFKIARLQAGMYMVELEQEGRKAVSRLTIE